MEPARRRHSRGYNQRRVADEAVWVAFAQLVSQCARIKPSDGMSHNTLVTHSVLKTNESIGLQAVSDCDIKTVPEPWSNPHTPYKKKSGTMLGAAEMQPHPRGVYEVSASC